MSARVFRTTLMIITFAGLYRRLTNPPNSFGPIKTSGGQQRRLIRVSWWETMEWLGESRRIFDDLIIRNRRLGDQPTLAHLVERATAFFHDFPFIGYATLLKLSPRELESLSVSWNDIEVIAKIMAGVIELCDRRNRLIPPGMRIDRRPYFANELAQIRLRKYARLSDIASMLGCTADELQSWELGYREPSALYPWFKALGLVCPPRNSIVELVDLSPMMMAFLRKDPARLRSLTPEQFERFVAEQLERMGFRVTLTGPTNRRDGGIDLIAVPQDLKLGSRVIAGQVKHHRDGAKTGRADVDRLLAWKDSSFGVGLLVTNTTFTKDAIWTAQQERNQHFLRLRDFGDLQDWLRGQWQTEKDLCEIPDSIELAPGITINVPKPGLI